MRIITRKRITEYSSIHADAEVALIDWYDKTTESEWNCFADVKETFNSVDSIGNNRFVFNVRGNKYRLVAIIIFASKKVYIRFIGTHSEYDKTKCSNI